jgi:hypothetical protein
MAKVKFVLLLPLTYNDGSCIPKTVMDQIEDSLFALAGGYHIAGTGKGAYRMRNGAKQIDETLQIWVVVDEEDEQALRTLVADFGKMLDQETMYFERINSTVEFVSSVSSGG